MVYFEQNAKADTLWVFTPEKRNIKILFGKKKNCDMEWDISLLPF